MIFLIVFSFLFSSINSVVFSEESNDNLTEENQKKWTIMIYEDMDFYHCLPGIGRLDYATQCKIRSNENVNVVVLQDTVFGPGKIWYMKENFGRKLAKNLGEISMGEYQTLKDFIDFTKNNFPADRYLIDFYNHGYGWVGCCWDETGKIDYLTMQEIYDGLNDSGGVDIASFLTPCNMGAIESIYELKDVCDVFIGREVGACMTKHVLGPLSDFLCDNYDLSTYDVGEKIIDIFIDGSSHPLSSIDMKSFRTDEMPDLIASINNLCVFLIDNIDNYYEEIKDAYDNAQMIPMDGRAEPSWVKKDIFDFLVKLKNVCPYNETLYGIIDDVINNINDTIINRYSQDEYPGLYAMHIYFPRFYYNGQPEPDFSYLDNDLDFVEDCLWDEFLSSYNSKEIFVDSYGLGDYEKIQDAVDNCKSGSIIYVKNGIYCEDVVIDKPLYIVGESFNETIIIGTGDNNVFEINSDNVTLHFLKISNSGEEKAAVKINADFVDICSCYITGNENGIIINSSDNVWVYYSTIKYNKNGIILDNCYDSKFKFNLICDNGKDCFFYDSFKTFWENVYDEERMEYKNLKPKIIPGYITIHGIKIPWFNMDFLHINYIKMIQNRIDAFIIDPLREIFNR